MTLPSPLAFCKKFALGVAMLTVWAAVLAQTQPAGEGAQSATVIDVGDTEHITYDDLRRYAARRIDLKALMASHEGWKAIAREYALTRVLMQEGQRLGVQRPPLKEEDAADPVFANDLYALKVYETLAKDCRFETSEAALKRYYDTHPEAFQVPARVRLQRIMLPDQTAIGPLAAPTWLTLQARAVTEGQANFDKLIERAREHTPGVHQGDIGWHVVDDRIDLLAAAGQAEVGNLVGPVREGAYWVLLRVTDKRPPLVPAWEDIRHQAHTIATQHCKETEHQRVMRELFEKYRVRIDVEAIVRAATIKTGS